MKILEISDFQNTGGASIAGKRIAKAIKDLGHDYIRISSDSSVPQTSLFVGKKFSILADLLNIAGLTFWTPTLMKKGILRQFRLHLQRHQPEQILFHNIHGTAWPLELLLVAMKYAPTTWTLHDCWSFLGSYYPSHSEPPKQQTLQKLNFFWKKVSNSNYNFSGISPSSWLREQAFSSLWSETHIETIQNPVPNSFFRDIDKHSARTALGLNPNQSTILCIAGNLAEDRKGGRILNEILESPISNKAQVLLVGEEKNLVCNNSKFVSIGFVQDELMLRMAYHAADLTLHTAPEDNLPNTVAESMSCGTPVIAFRTGGLPEMIVDDECGWLVKNLDSDSMIEKLWKVLAKKDLRSISMNARKRAHSLFNERAVALKYEAHFQKMHQFSNL